VVSIMDAVLCIAAASDSSWKQRRPNDGYKRPKSVSKSYASSINKSENKTQIKGCLVRPFCISVAVNHSTSH